MTADFELWQAMHADCAGPCCSVIDLEFSDEEWRLICRAAEQDGMSPEAWMHRAIYVGARSEGWL